MPCVAYQLIPYVPNPWSSRRPFLAHEIDGLSVNSALAVLEELYEIVWAHRNIGPFGNIVCYGPRDRVPSMGDDIEWEDPELNDIEWMTPEEMADWNIKQVHDAADHEPDD